MADESNTAVPAPPSWLTDARALEEWTRCAANIPQERLGILAVYCTVHGRLLSLLDDPKAAARAASLIGQYRTLAAALFGTGGSKRAQPGKNPFQQLRDRKARKVEAPAVSHRRYVVRLRPEHYDDAWAKRLYANDPDVAAELRKRYAGAFVKVGGSVSHDLQDAQVIGWQSAKGTRWRYAQYELIPVRIVLESEVTNYAAPVTPGPRPRAKSKGRSKRKS